MPARSKIEKKKNYSQLSIDKAVTAVQSGLSLRQASVRFGVPKSTLFSKTKNIHPVNAKMGPPTILSPEEEEILIRWIFHASEKGFPINKEQLLDSVQLLVSKMQRDTPFTDNRPGRHWYESFIRRHPELTERVAQNLTHSRASATEEKLRSWFNEVANYLTAQQLLNIDSSRVFNCDESAFLLCPKADNVLVRKGSRSVYKIVNADEKECLTTLFMVNAAGTMTPPMVMYWYQRIPYSVSSNIPQGWSIGTSDSGWMTAETFYEYITNVFHPWLISNQVEFPIVLFVDGHSSHLTLPLSNFCRDNKIELIALYPNATHILQPLDVAVFHPLKNSWKKTVNRWRLENNGARLKKEMFAPLLKDALDSVNLTNTIKQGFRTCGLYPFSADSVDFNVLKKGMKLQETSRTDHSNLAQSECKKELHVIEHNLPSDVRIAFQQSESSGVWTGEKKNEGLFLFWLQIKKRAALDDASTNLSSRSYTDDNVENITIDSLIDHRESNIETVLQQEGSIIFNVQDDGALEIIPAEAGSTENQLLSVTELPWTQGEKKQQYQEINNPGGSGIIQSQAPQEIPEVFRKTLFWPENVKKNKKKRTDKIPTVATSDDWLNYHTAKENAKRRQIEEKEARKKKREAAQAEKKNLLAEKKAHATREKKKASRKKTARKK